MPNRKSTARSVTGERYVAPRRPRFVLINRVRAAIAISAALMTLMLSACVSDSVAPLKAPPKVSVAPSSLFLPAYDESDTPIVPVKSSARSAAIGSGGASMHGRVTLGGAPIGGATVRIERFVGDAVATRDVSSASDGTWGLNAIPGGRYRVRAFRPPDATMPSAQVFFLGGSESKGIDFDMRRYGGGGVSMGAAIAPSPPILGAKANVVISLNGSGVDSSGVARSIPQSGIPLTLSSGSGRVILSGNPATTDGSGRAVWTIGCASLDAQALSVTFPDGSVQPVNVAPCQLPPPTTTTTTTLSPTVTPAPSDVSPQNNGKGNGRGNGN